MKNEELSAWNSSFFIFDFLVLFAPVLRQIARYLPHHRSEKCLKNSSQIIAR